jgi:hypothetical protein
MFILLEIMSLNEKERKCRRRLHSFTGIVKENGAYPVSHKMFVELGCSPEYSQLRMWSKVLPTEQIFHARFGGNAVPWYC